MSTCMRKFRIIWNLDWSMSTFWPPQAWQCCFWLAQDRIPKREKDCRTLIGSLLLMEDLKDRICNNVSDSCLAKFRACETQEFWSMQIPKAATEADLARYVQVPNHDRQHDRREPEELLFNRIVSDNVLLRPTNLSESVRNIMAQKPKNNSDAILALREVRELLLDSETKYTRGGVKEVKQRMNIQQLVEDKFYDGKIMRKTPQGMLIDINADSLGLLRWNLLRGIPKKLQKVGGFIGNLLVTKVDLESGRVNLKLQTIGFDHDTLEETEYSEVLGYLHYWSGLPEAPPFARQAPESPAPVEEFRPLAPRRCRLNRMGRNGPRRWGGCLIQCAQKFGVPKGCFCRLWWGVGLQNVTVQCLFSSLVHNTHPARYSAKVEHRSFGRLPSFPGAFASTWHQIQLWFFGFEFSVLFSWTPKTWIFDLWISKIVGEGFSIITYFRYRICFQHIFLCKLHSPLRFIVEVQWGVLRLEIILGVLGRRWLLLCWCAWALLPWWAEGMSGTSRSRKRRKPKFNTSLLWNSLNMNWQCWALLQIIISTTPDTMLQGNLEQT